MESTGANTQYMYENFGSAWKHENQVIKIKLKNPKFTSMYKNNACNQNLQPIIEPHNFKSKSTSSRSSHETCPPMKYGEGWHLKEDP